MTVPKPGNGEAATDLAVRVGESMFSRDHASQGLGIRIEAISPGRAILSMSVRQDMLNGHQICHGGFIFTLADSSFAFACNSRNEMTVAAGCSIEFLRPVREGERLTATAEERVLTGRTGIYDITVIDGAGKTVAMFRGKSRRIEGEVLPANDS